MRITNNPYSRINSPSQDFQTASESPSSPPAQRAKTEVGQQASTSKTSFATVMAKLRQQSLLRDIQKQSCDAMFLSDANKIHNQNVEKVDDQVNAFIEKFVAEKPDALPTDIRDGISSNLGQIVKDAQLDLSCYLTHANGEAGCGQHLIFSSLSVPLLNNNNAPVCFLLFHAKPGQTPLIHNQHNPEHNPAEAPPQPVLVECASCVVDGMINDLRVIGNPGENPPHSIENPEDPITTVHAYHIDGISDGQTVAVQSEFVAGFTKPNNALYSAYEALVGKVKTGGADRAPIPKIDAKNLLKALKENKFGANPVIVDIREPDELQSGALHIEGARMLHVPRGVAIAKILADFPDRNTHLLLACRYGARSALLADDLRALGYKSTVVSDGTLGCSMQGLLKIYDADSQIADKWNEELDLAPPALTEHIRQLKSSISKMTAEELASTLKKMKKNLLVFDVRQENEQSSGVIPNARCVPAGEFEKKARFHAENLSESIVIYSGDDGDYRALIAARNLMEMGYTNVRYLEGGYKNHIGQGVPASPPSQIPMGTQEIQEEQESHLLSSAASLNHGFNQDLERQGSPTVPSNTGRRILAQYFYGLRGWLEKKQAQANGDREQPKELGDLPKSREVLFNSRNLAARNLGTALEYIQSQYMEGDIDALVHAMKSDHILDAAKLLFFIPKKGQDLPVLRDVLAPEELSKILRDVLPPGLKLDDEMSRLRHVLTKEEYLAIVEDVTVQHDPIAGVVAVRESERAAEEAKHALQNKKREITAKGLSHVFDGAASTLSYSAAAINNGSLYKRSIGSGTTWAAAASLSFVSRCASPSQIRSGVGMRSDVVNLGAAFAGLTATILSNQTNPNQKSVNYAAMNSNALLMTSCILGSVAAIQNGRRVASTYGTSALAYTATGLEMAGNLANMVSAGVGMASTATSNGSNLMLNQAAAVLWMSGTVLGAASTAVGTVNRNRREREENRIMESEREAERRWNKEAALSNYMPRSPWNPQYQFAPPAPAREGIRTGAKRLREMGLELSSMEERAWVSPFQVSSS